MGQVYRNIKQKSNSKLGNYNPNIYISHKNINNNLNVYCNGNLLWIFKNVIEIDFSLDGQKWIYKFINFIMKLIIFEPGYSSTE